MYGIDSRWINLVSLRKLFYKKQRMNGDKPSLTSIFFGLNWWKDALLELYLMLWWTAMLLCWDLVWYVHWWIHSVQRKEGETDVEEWISRFVKLHFSYIEVTLLWIISLQLFHQCDLSSIYSLFLVHCIPLSIYSSVPSYHLHFIFITIFHCIHFRLIINIIIAEYTADP